MERLDRDFGLTDCEGTAARDYFGKMVIDFPNFFCNGGRAISLGRETFRGGLNHGLNEQVIWLEVDERLCWGFIGHK